MGTGRWGIGLLERNRSSEAKPGEALQNSNVGMFATKSEDGTLVVSYDYMTRFNSAYSDFKKALAAAGNSGIIAKVDLSENEPAILVEPNRVYTAADSVISDKKLKFIQLYFDIDVIDRVTGVPIPQIYPIISISMTAAKNTATGKGLQIVAEDTVGKINSKVFIPDYSEFDENDENVNFDSTIDTISVKLPDGALVENYGIILHALLIGFKEVE